MNLSARFSKKGFTLIELLVVIGILAVLLAIVLIAINPARQFAQANDTARRSHVNAILNAIHQYAADNKGNITALGITTTAQTIGKGGAGLLDLCGPSQLVTQYIADIPLDPKTGTKACPGGGTSCTCTAATAYNTGYTVQSSATDNRITVSATGEIPPASVISVTR